MTSTATSPTAPVAPPDPPPRRKWSPSKRLLPYLLVAPALCFELLVHLLPMLGGLYMSVLELTQFYLRDWLSAPWAGLANFRFALDFDGAVGAALLRSFAVTAGFSVLTVGLSWLLGVFAATLLQRSFRGRAVLRTLFLVPYALPVYTAAMIWKFLLDQDDGMVNATLGGLGITDGKTFWLLGDNAFLATVATATWRLWPFAFLVLMAGMQSIPHDVYESATVDGAGLWQQFRNITLPMLRPVNQVLVLVLFLWTFNDFNVPYILFDKSVPSAANLLSIHIYNNSFITWNFGMGSAMSTLLLLFLLVVTAGYLAFTSRRMKDA
ncbi:carbohydrate ABC transporter permease [Saccharopolyspora flava]|uniref:Carbohydrate ABC transporter membrane protein 1, CUT1 family n=1 Tax=Saccharopolyspora flava TaxID=95161 RepID=A0A1I6SPV0_9PSEU|nr:sugar ABC transporter permease [Saccharopolyspora flava]SFS78984.1 carbohydrate ABC transporter membrane protein 1, CUT1 family [Saccharopolyspora flava]